MTSESNKSRLLGFSPYSQPGKNPPIPQAHERQNDKTSRNTVIPVPIFTGPTEHVEKRDYGFNDKPGYQYFYTDMEEGYQAPLPDVIKFSQ